MKLDLSVIGGGIIGLTSAAMIKAERPDWTIAIFEKSLVGTGASLYSLGVDFPIGRTEEKRRLTLESIEQWKKLKSIVPELDIRHHPLSVVVSSNSLEEAKKAVLAELDAPIEGKFNRLHLKGAAAYSGDVYATCKELALWLKKQGVQIFEGTPVFNVESCENGYIFNSLQSVINSERVIEATGPWLTQKTKGIRTKKIACLHIASDIRLNETTPLYYFFDDDAFLLPDYQSNQWKFSFTLCQWDCLPTEQFFLNEKILQSGRAILSRYCKKMAANVMGGRVFCDAYSKDFTPAVFQVDDSGRRIAVTAGSGSGYRLAPALANRIKNHFTQQVALCRK